MDFKKETFDAYFEELHSRLAEKDKLGVPNPCSPQGMDVRRAMETLLRTNIVDADSAANVGNELAAIMGEFAAHWLLAVHGDKNCVTCGVGFMSVFAGVFNGGLFSAQKRAADREAALLATKAIKDGPDIDPNGPADGTKLN